MYVCTCKSVSDHQIRQAVAQGARGFGDLSTRFVGIGIECGKCVDGVNALLQECLSAASSSPPASVEVASQPITAPAASTLAPKEATPAPAWFAIDL